MTTAKAKREAVTKTFGPIPLDSQHLDWLYARRHLATVREGKWRELAYVVECDNLEQVIWKTLDKIRKRDGAKIANEVAGRLADSIAME
jgi:nucleoside-triphosphatase THEP1